jgi:hypothetical protein
MNIARSLAAGPPVLEEPRLAVVSTTGAGADSESARAAAGKASTRRKAGATASETRPPATEPTPVTAEEGDGGAEPGLPDETLTAGGPEAPGRRIRIRQLRPS